MATEWSSYALTLQSGNITLSLAADQLVWSRNKSSGVLMEGLAYETFFPQSNLDCRWHSEVWHWNIAQKNNFFSMDGLGRKTPALGQSVEERLHWAGHLHPMQTCGRIRHPFICQLWF